MKRHIPLFDRLNLYASLRFGGILLLGILFSQIILSHTAPSPGLCAQTILTGNVTVSQQSSR